MLELIHPIRSPAPTMQLLLVFGFVASLPLVLAGVPFLKCSWKVTDESPELVGFEWWYNAEKRVTNNSAGTAEYARHYVDLLADYGGRGLDKQLRFWPACPEERGRGWGWTSFPFWRICVSNPWVVCIGANGPNDRPIRCFVRSELMHRRMSLLTCTRPSSSSTISGSTRKMAVSVEECVMLVALRDVLIPALGRFFPGIWPDTFDSAQSAPDMVQIWKKK